MGNFWIYFAALYMLTAIGMTIFSEIAFTAWVRSYETKRPIAKLFMVHPCIKVDETRKRRPTNRDRLRAVMVACIPVAGAGLLVVVLIWAALAALKRVLVRIFFGSEVKYERWLNS